VAALFVPFLYGPISIALVSFQGPDGGLTLPTPMYGVFSHRFSKLWNGGLPNADIWAFARSAWLGLVVMMTGCCRGWRACLSKALFWLRRPFLRRHRQF